MNIRNIAKKQNTVKEGWVIKNSEFLVNKMAPIPKRINEAIVNSELIKIEDQLKKVKSPEKISVNFVTL